MILFCVLLAAVAWLIGLAIPSRWPIFIAAFLVAVAAVFQLVALTGALPA